MMVKMGNNIMKKVKLPKITRIDIDLVFEDNSMDVMIGRAAHISLIDNYNLVQMLVYAYGHLFS